MIGLQPDLQFKRSETSGESSSVETRRCRDEITLGDVPRSGKVTLEKCPTARPCTYVIYKLHSFGVGNPPLSDHIGQGCFRRLDVGAAGRSDQGQDSDPDRSPFSGKLWRLQSFGQRLIRIADRLGPGYRVYYALAGKACVLLLCGGDKRKQASDIKRALEYLKDYRERTP